MPWEPAGSQHDPGATDMVYHLDMCHAARWAPQGEPKGDLDMLQSDSSCGSSPEAYEELLRVSKKRNKDIGEVGHMWACVHAMLHLHVHMWWRSYEEEAPL